MRTPTGTRVPRRIHPPPFSGRRPTVRWVAWFAPAPSDDGHRCPVCRRCQHNEPAPERVVRAAPQTVPRVVSERCCTAGSRHVVNDVLAARIYRYDGYPNNRNLSSGIRSGTGCTTGDSGRRKPARVAATSKLCGHPTESEPFSRRGTAHGVMSPHLVDDQITAATVVASPHRRDPVSSSLARSSAVRQSTVVPTIGLGGCLMTRPGSDPNP